MPAYSARPESYVGALLFTGDNVQETIDFIGLNRIVGCDLLAISKYLKVETTRGYYCTLHQGSYIVRFKDGSVEIMNQRVFDKIYLRTTQFSFTEEEFDRIICNANNNTPCNASFCKSKDGNIIQFHIPVLNLTKTESELQDAQDIIKKKLDPQGQYNFYFETKYSLSGYISKGENYVISNCSI